MREFRRAGATPGARDTNGSPAWLQSVPLINFSPPREVRFSFSGGQQAVDLEFGRNLILTSRSVDGRVSVTNAPVFFVGHCIVAPGRDDLRDVDLTGAIALFLPGEPDDELETGPFQGRVQTMFGQNDYKRRMLVQKGAIGAFIISRFRSDEGRWQGQAARAREPYQGLSTAVEPDLPMRGLIARDAAAALFAQAGRDLDTARSAAIDNTFRARRLGDLQFSAQSQSETRIVQSANVVARIEGADLKQESVIFCAHWDHLGRAPVEDADNIYNGAWDNATGVAGLLELARVFAHSRPRRTIAFLAFTAEESSLLGSAFYAANPIWSPSLTAAVSNLDMLAIQAATRDLEIFAPGKSDIESIVAEAAAAQGRVIVPELEPYEGLYYRSDHYSLAKIGIPAVQLRGGVDLIVGGASAGRQERDDLTSRLYHTVEDEFGPHIRFDGMIQDLEVHRAIAQRLGWSRDWPQWSPNAEFRSIRDLSAAERA